MYKFWLFIKLSELFIALISKSLKAVRIIKYNCHYLLFIKIRFKTLKIENSHCSLVANSENNQEIQNN